MDVETVTTNGDNALLSSVRSVLEHADEALLAVAFVKSAGVNLIEPQLKRLGKAARLVLTTTFSENSAALAKALSLRTCINVLNPSNGTNHAKVYVGRRGKNAIALIGSCNLTGGLVSNIEAGVLLRGKMNDAPIKAAWEFAEGLWQHERCVAWSPDTAPVVEETFTPELLAALQAAVAANNGVFTTLAQGKPNRVTDVTTTGIYVVTDASVQKGTPAQFVPAWMIQIAWDYLRAHGRLSNRYLVAADGLNVKRSSAVCAIIAALPGIDAKVVTGEGIVLKWGGCEPLLLPDYA
jgi:HKD family nuclease